MSVDSPARELFLTVTATLTNLDSDPDPDLNTIRLTLSSAVKSGAGELTDTNLLLFVVIGAADTPSTRRL